MLDLNNKAEETLQIPIEQTLAAVKSYPGKQQAVS